MIEVYEQKKLLEYLIYIFKHNEISLSDGEKKTLSRLLLASRILKCKGKVAISLELLEKLYEKYSDA